MGRRKATEVVASDSTYLSHPLLHSMQKHACDAFFELVDALSKTLTKPFNVSSPGVVLLVL